jgi:hypothetical protein
MFTIASGNDNNSRWIANLLAEKRGEGMIMWSDPFVR